MKTLTQFVRFCIVGGTGAVVHFSLLWMLTEYAGFHYMMSALLSAGVATFINFTGNKVWTFRDVHTPMPADYDWKAYFSGNPIQRWWKHQLVLMIRQDVGYENPVVDVGCGSSPLLSMIPLRDKVGVDHDQRKIALMREKDPSATYKLGEAYNTNLDPNCSSVTVCAEVIEHLDQPELLIQELVRITKPGGRIIIATPDFASWRWNLVEFLYGVFMSHGYHEEHHTKFTESSLKALTAAYGLRWERTRKVWGADMVIKFWKPA